MQLLALEQSHIVLDKVPVIMCVGGVKPESISISHSHSERAFKLNVAKRKQHQSAFLRGISLIKSFTPSTQRQKQITQFTTNVNYLIFVPSFSLSTRSVFVYENALVDYASA